MKIAFALYILAALAQLVCAVIVLIQLFKSKGALHGILGFFCLIYTFIWGWMNAKALNLSTIMKGWTAAIVVMVIAGITGGVAAVTSPEGQKAFQDVQRAAQEAAAQPVPATK